jgi:hypothetical protein
MKNRSLTLFTIDMSNGFSEAVLDNVSESVVFELCNTTILDRHPKLQWLIIGNSLSADSLDHNLCNAVTYTRSPDTVFENKNMMIDLINEQTSVNKNVAVKNGV